MTPPTIALLVSNVLFAPRTVKSKVDAKGESGYDTTTSEANHRRMCGPRLGMPV
jgi:hypothetical protein